MAKISYAKLGLSKTKEDKQLEWNGQKVDVKQYLPILDKIEMITRILNYSLDTNGYYNPSRIELFTTLEIILSYTNINCTEKQKEDVCKLYDSFVASGFADAVMNLIPENEKTYIIDGAIKMVQSVYEYKTSILGILDAVARDYGDTEFNVKQLLEKLQDSDIQALKEIADKIG